MSTNNDENEPMVHDDNDSNEQQPNNTKPPKKSRPSMTIDEINALNYRALQKKCKSVGLSAGGSTVVLRERLSDHFEVNTDNKNIDSVEDGDSINDNDSSEPAFNNNDEPAVNDNTADKEDEVAVPMPVAEKDESENVETATDTIIDSVLPTKDEGDNTNIVETEVVTAEPPLNTDSPSEEELLAEMHAISNKSASTNRFDEVQEEEKVEESESPSTSDIGDTAVVATTDETKTEEKRIILPPLGGKKQSSNADEEEEELPPWKQKGAKTTTIFPDSSTDAVLDPFQNAIMLEEDNINDDTKKKDDITPPEEDIKVIDKSSEDETTTNQEAVAVEEKEPTGDDKKGITSDLPKTFVGDRGGVAEDAELLAELRAISSGNRFDGGDTNKSSDEGNTDSQSRTDNNDGQIISEKKKVEDDDDPNLKSTPTTNLLPPWKQKKNKPVMKNEVDIIIAAPVVPEKSGSEEECAIKSQNDNSTTIDDSTIDKDEQKEVHTGIKTNLPNTFKGDRGGSAEDADLLAELRAISNQSSSNRFDSEEQNEGNPVISHSIAPTNSTKEMTTVETQDDKSESKLLPPWKRPKKKKVVNNDFDVVVAAAPPPQPTQHASPDVPVNEEQIITNIPEESNMGIKSSLPNTFKGDRGGDAEDAALLAELRAISMQSSSNRFDGDDTVSDDITRPTEEKKDIPPQKKLAEPTKTESSSLPPWKRPKAKEKAEVEVDVVIAPPSKVVPEKIETQNDDSINNNNSAPTLDEEKKGSIVKSNLPNTFKGDRGGSAEDADLLAELKAISNQSSSSRFDGGDNNDATGTSEVDDAHKKVVPSSGKVSTKTSSKAETTSLPPWKQPKKKKNAETSSSFDVLVAAPPKPTSQSNNSDAVVPSVQGNDEVLNTNVGIKSNLPNTFKGERGGSAEDADLLAELRAISNQSSSNRFDSDDQNEENPVISHSIAPTDSTKETKEANTVDEKSQNKQPLPPWKRPKKKKADANNDFEVVVSAPPSLAVAPSEVNNEDDIDEDDDEAFFPNVVESNDNTVALLKEEEMGIAKPNLPNTFKGNRGGAAEDAALLAELRAISNQSSSNRFDNNEDQGADGNAVLEEKVVPPPKKAEVSSLPPWKRPKAKKKAEEVEVNVVVAAPAKSETQNKVKAISSGVVEEQKAEVNIKGITSNLPNTFKGDRGGAAEDADLLAELRAISIQSSSNRFDSTDNDEGEATNVVTEKKAPPPPRSKPSTETSSKAETTSLPPWKRPKKKKADTNHAFDVVVAAAPQPTSQPNASSAVVAEKDANTFPSPAADDEKKMGIAKSNLPNTFKGDRGGSAEDADLLAELRAISMQSSSNRFANGSEETDNNGVVRSEPSNTKIPADNTVKENKSIPDTIAPPPPNHQPVSSFNKESTSISTDPFNLGVSSMPSAAPSSSSDEINITLEGLDESIKSSNWQIRKASYLFLHERILSLSPGSENSLSYSVVYASLDQAVINALKDKNAGALDAALTFSNIYADRCEGACTDDVASQIMTALLKGSAFSSARKGTQTSTEELVLKLIEVSPEGSSVINTVFDLINEHGLKSRKPKMVIFSATLIMKSVQSFGANMLPIKTLMASSESLVAHANAQAREIGIQLLAEICRSLGGSTKGPVQSLVDQLKKAQQSQLDSLLEAQPSATSPSRRLRCKSGEQASTQAPEEVLAALQKSVFADRAAVNLLQALSKTCYKESIKLPKWSEKVAALDALIEAGGEQPYKLCPPSSSVNYTPLIRELKELLAHTHFAVCSKALAALGMLAEGVGEELYGNFRPLIPTLAALFKDKKVIKAVSSCLDQMFGSVFSFEHLLDSKESLPTSLDEKKQKNALVRKNVLEYIARCVKTSQSDSCGTRGDLTSAYAEGLSKLACEKLKDSDASTRKAATDVLLALLSCKDASVVSATEKYTSKLETTNPRAFKSLKLASNGGKSKTTARPQTAPASTKATSKNEPLSKGNVSKPAKNAIRAPPKPHPSLGSDDSGGDDKTLPSFEESIEKLSSLSIAKWGDSIDDEGVLAGIQSSNWRARQGALGRLATYFKDADAEQVFDSIPSLFVLVRDCTKSFKESNFNVSKSLLELFTVIFGIHSQLIRPPESYLYLPATKLAVEKIADKKLSDASAMCLDTICTVKDPQRVFTVAIKTIGAVKAPMVHEGLLCWFKKFCVEFGVASLSQGTQEVITWVLKECESNNLKLRNAALDAIGEMHTQIGPVLQAFLKSKNIQTSTMSLIEKAISKHPHDDSVIEREMKCITLSVESSNNSSNQGSSSSRSNALLSIPTTDLMASLKSDCISRISETEGKAAWKIRRDAMEEVRLSVDKCGGLISAEGKAFVSLKQLFLALRSRLNDSQSNLKPVAATLIGSLLNHLDDETQAKLGKAVFAHLANAAMNDMKKTMRDAAISAISMGTEQHVDKNINLTSIESFIFCLEAQLSDAALKSSGLPDVLTFLTGRLELCFSGDTERSSTISVNKQLAKVIIQSLLSSKAGSRSAAEKLLNISTKNELVRTEDFDKEISKLLPAQQRTVRSFIPKNSIQDQQLVDTFKKSSSRAAARQAPTRPSSSSSRQPAWQAVPKATAAPPPSSSLLDDSFVRESHETQHNTTSANPLHSSGTTKSTKEKRLSVLGRSDNWPDYPEDPSGDDATLQMLRKTWSQLISPVSTELLFPKGGFRSHEDTVRGCELLDQSIDYSRSCNDSAFIVEQLDLILKWLACALSSRDHTSGLRSLLSTLQQLFEHLNEISYIMNDPEAIILLPHIIEKAGVAKSQFKNQFMDLLSFIRVKKLYALDRYGTIICMRVVDKSKSNRARSLAATECSLCVQEIGAGAIGSKGIATLAKALSLEKLKDIRKSYLDLFDIVIQKTSLERVLKRCVGDSVTDATKEDISNWCSSKRPSTAPASSTSNIRTMPTSVSEPNTQSKLRSPSSNTISESVVTGNPSSRSNNQIPGQQFSASAKATETLRSRFAKLNDSSITKVDLYQNSIKDILELINGNGTKEKGLQAIHILSSALKGNDQSDANLKQSITSNLDQLVETLSSTLKFALDKDANSELPVQLIVDTVNALSYVFRTPEYPPSMSEESVECCLREMVHALLDDRLVADNLTRRGIDRIDKPINKLATRIVTSPPREIPLLALLSLQKSTLESASIEVEGERTMASRTSRVYTKLYHKVMKDKHEKNPSNPLYDVELDLLLFSIDFLLYTIETICSSAKEQAGDDMVKHAREMSKSLMTELITCTSNTSVRDILAQLELPSDSPVEKLLVDCEHEMGLQTTSSQQNQANTTVLSDLINKFASAQGPDKQVALVAIVDMVNTNDIDLEAHCKTIDISPAFKEFLIDQVNKASKENSNEDAVVSVNPDSIKERMKAIRSTLEPTETKSPPVVVDSLRARLEALKRND